MNGQIRTDIDEKIHNMILDFVAKWQLAIRDREDRLGFTRHITLGVKSGKKYLKVTASDGSPHSCSAYAFVDLWTGDIYKAASWNSPAKHSRGNVMNPDNGMNAVGAYGVNYLR